MCCVPYKSCSMGCILYVWKHIAVEKKKHKKEINGSIDRLIQGGGGVDSFKISLIQSVTHAVLCKKTD